MSCRAKPIRARGAARGVQAVQARRPEAREAVLPVRDVPRHGDEPRRRGRDHRARLHLEVHDPGRPRRAPSAGWLGPLYADKADPGTMNFVPRPDWYFYFLFYLLRIFKWPDTVILGTIGIPTICLILLLALPFIDLRRERRLLAPAGRDRRRRSSSSSRWASLTYKGATAKEALASEILGAVPSWVEEAGVRGQRQALAGREVFAQCRLPEAATRTSAPARPNLGAPDLSAEGAKGEGIDVPDQPPEVPELRERRARRCRPSPSSATSNLRKLADLPRGLEGRRSSTARCRRTPCASSSAITGASGAPYAARLLEALAAADCEVGVCASTAGHRGARDRAVRRRAPLARRDARPLRRARGRRGDGLRPERLARAVRERLGQGRRLRHLPVLDGHARDDRLRRDVEPDPPRRLGRAEGGAEARRDAARDAALDDPPREHAHAPRGRRDDPLPRARLLPRSRDRGRPRRLRRRPRPRPARDRERAVEAVGAAT